MAQITAGINLPKAQKGKGQSSGKASEQRSKTTKSCNFPNLKKGAN